MAHRIPSRSVYWLLLDTIQRGAQARNGQPEGRPGGYSCAKGSFLCILQTMLPKSINLRHCRVEMTHYLCTQANAAINEAVSIAEKAVACQTMGTSSPAKDPIKDTAFIPSLAFPTVSRYPLEMEK